MHGFKLDVLPPNQQEVIYQTLAMKPGTMRKLTDKAQRTYFKNRLPCRVIVVIVLETIS